MVGKLIPSPVKPKAEIQEIRVTPQKSNIWYIESDEYKSRKKTKLWKQSTIRFSSVFMIFLILVILLWPMLSGVNSNTLFFLNRQLTSHSNYCSFELVESIPEDLNELNLTHKHVSTFGTWKKLISMAEHTIEIGSFYWTLKKWDEFPVESQKGDEIFNDLLEAGLKRNILIKIAQNKPSNFSKDDTEILVREKAAQVKSVDFNALLGVGVLHSKFWIVDRKHLYIGSANMDWRSLTEGFVRFWNRIRVNPCYMCRVIRGLRTKTYTEILGEKVKELGIAIYNCTTIARDLAKIFDVYWTVGNKTTLPAKWPDYLNTMYNSKNPIKVNLNGQPSSIFLSSAPPKFSASGRDGDIDAILSLIRNAKKFIHISVMDYIPLMLYSKNIEFWPVIDNELRRAVIDRNIEVRLLTSKWRSTRPIEIKFLQSLLALNKSNKNSVLEVKLFVFPKPKKVIPFAGVNHNKYMVTDSGALIGTSNWSGDYFVTTAGVSLVSISENDNTTNIIQEQLKEIFDRDWNSPFAKPLPPNLF